MTVLAKVRMVEERRQQYNNNCYIIIHRDRRSRGWSLRARCSIRTLIILCVITIRGIGKVQECDYVYIILLSVR